jgi:DNA-binding GntR family transcriptional regulator
MKTKTTQRTDGGRISRAYEQLYDLIVHGRLPPGARIAEGTLAETLGVSRTPIREAMHRLQQEGLLIEVSRGSGLRARLAVAPLERERMEEVYALAGAIEGLAVRRLSKVAPAKREALARELERIERAFHAEARRKTPEYDRLFELHQAFHRTLVESVAGPETRAVLRTIKPQVDRYEWFYAPLTGPDFTPTRREHAAIINAVRHGNAQELERSVRANYSNGGQRVGPLIEQFDGRLPVPTPTFSIDRL